MSADSSDNTASDNAEIDLASGIAAFEAKHFPRAMQLLSPAAEQGNPQAQHMLAIMYQNGLGVVQSDMAAYKWMRDSAEQDYALAQHGIGFMYLEGECIVKNGAKAAEWFTKAADQGLQGSMTTLAMMYQQGKGVEQNQEEAQRLFKLAGFDEMI